ncbi:MAG: BamA/TamA family outer membrane protein [Chitinophagaceae bacterium]
MKRIQSVLLIISVSLLFAACSNTRRLPQGDALYIGATIRVEDSTRSKGEKKELRGKLAGLPRPVPNKKILGVRVKLSLYNLAGNPKKERSPAGFIKNKLGEPPVLLSDVDLTHNEKVLQSYLENTGHFQAVVRGDTTVKRKKARAIYTVRPGPQYMIDSVIFDKDSSELSRHIDSSSVTSFLKPDEPFDLQVIKAERDRIDDYLKQRGYYYFDPDYILIQVDSTIGATRANLYIRVKQGTPLIAKRVYTIGKVYIFPTFRLGAATADTLIRNATFYKGFYVVDPRERYKPRMFEEAMRFKPGEVYNRTDQNASLNRLVNMGVFKFVKNRFEVVPRRDSAMLDAFYYLTPLSKKSLRVEVNASTKSNNLTGSALTLGWRNRNTFRGGELFSIDATGGFEVQFSGNFRGFNTYRGGLEANLTIPRFLVPVFRFNTSSSYIPKTRFKLGYDLLTKQKLYTLTSFRAEFGYVWKESAEKEHTFNPIAVNYVQPARVSKEYMDRAIEQPILLKAIERQFIIGTNYNFNYNQLQGERKNGLYYNLNVDMSGNIVGLVTGASQRNPKEIFGSQFSQYVKVESDVRYYLKLGRNTNKVLANRLILGYGLPYGNSLSLPFVKQFFVGGTNGLRAFRSRSVGPGAFRDNSIDSTGFQPDQSGDIKIEFNTELRAKLVGIVHGAFFIDVGNIWLKNDDTSTIEPRPGVKFTKNFIKEFAVGTGVGLRFDISFLVLRLDLAMPLRKPFLPDGQRWVFNQINFGSPTWRKQNLILNLGIGYPF